jgi:hypothetical protein
MLNVTAAVPITADSRANGCDKGHKVAICPLSSSTRVQDQSLTNLRAGLDHQ